MTLTKTNTGGTDNGQQAQQQVGRAFFEMADYPRARKALEAMQQVGRQEAEKMTRVYV